MSARLAELLIEGATGGTDESPGIVEAKPIRRYRLSDANFELILREAEVGRKISQACRAYGVSRESFYRWKRLRAHQSLDANVQRLHELEDENRRLREIVANLSLEKHALQRQLVRKF